MALSAGTKAPDFTLKDTDNQPVSLSSFKGKNVILAFFPAAFSGVCDTEMCSFRDAMSDFNNVGANVIGVSVDSRFANKEFKTKHQLNFPILSDHTREATNKYGVGWPNFGGMEGYTAANRSVFAIDKQGNIKWAWVADKPPTLPNMDDVKKAAAALGK